MMGFCLVTGTGLLFYLANKGKNPIINRLLSSWGC